MAVWFVFQAVNLASQPIGVVLHAVLGACEGFQGRVLQLVGVEGFGFDSFGEAMVNLVQKGTEKNA